MQCLTNKRPSIRRRTRALQSAGLIVGALAMATTALVVSPMAAHAEISPNAEPSWGVYNLDTNTQSNAIRSLVFAIEQIDNTIYVGGKFLETRATPNASPTSQPYLAAFDATTGAHIASFNPSVESAVYSLQASPDGSRLFVGGEFRSVNGDRQAHGLAALDPKTGAVDTSWRAKVSNSSGARGMVHSLTISNNHLYLAGRFDQVGGMSQPLHTTEKLARVSLSDGAADTSLSTDIEGGAVWGVAVAPDASKIYLAGYHDTVNGDTAGADFTVLDANGVLQVAMSDVGGNASSSRRYGQDVVAVGDYVFWGGSEHIVRVFRASDGALVREHSTDRGGDFQDLEVVGDRVYASCHCYTNHLADFNYWPARKQAIPASVLRTPIKYVAAYSAATGEYLPSFSLDASAARAGVWAIHGDNNDCLWVGGDLTRVTSVGGGNQAAGGFAKFCEGGGSDAFAPTEPGAPTQTRAEKRRLVIRWNAATDNVAVDHYRISRDGVVVGTKPATGKRQIWFTDTGVAEASSYNYEIVAVDTAGNVSSPAAITATTAGTPPAQGLEAPTGLRSTRQTRERIVLNWAASPGADSYIVQRDDGAGYATIGTKTSRWFTDRTVAAATSYSYRVIAVGADGIESAPSAALSAQTLP